MRPPEQAFPARIARDKGAIDVVLVTIDAERADFLTPYGEKLPTTPFLEKLAAEGVTFKNAFSPAPWTVPAMYSIITGLYPSEHGLTSGQTVGQHVVGQEALPGEAFTLTERLAGLGYSTFGINTNYHMAPQFGFNQGFDRYLGDDFAFMPFPNLAVAGLRDEILSSPKYFLWLHYFDPHFPYIAQPPWFGEWNDSRFRTLFDLSTDVSLRYYWHKRGLPPKSPIRQEDAVLVHKLINLLTARSILLFHGLPKVKDLVDENYIRFFTAAYKSTLRQTDESMEVALKALGVDDQTLLIVTSDHGEELFDHGELGHRKNSSLYQELIRVPLIIYLPGGRAAGTVIDTPVSVIDIYPTVLDLLDQPIPDNLSGRSLRPLFEGKDLKKRPIFAEVSGRMGEARAIIEYPWKYIHNYTTQRGELYHLEQDPGEKDNRTDLEKARVKEMFDRLEKWKQSMAPRWKIEQTAPLSLPEINRLKQMGYLK
ncbi:MAG: sulfatase-like hydrolase/transferase [Deltaproteobacteria bacterium]|nr:sulfatase-like hydrolase/transferase [Deltaproteobacteria bacterium]